MIKTIYYSINNNGDGSASVSWSEDETLARIHQELQNLDDGWAEDCVGQIDIEYEGTMNLPFLIFDITRESLLNNVREQLDWCSPEIEDNLRSILDELKHLN